MWRAPAAGLAESAYRLSRVLESRSFGLTPEQVGIAEGLRAATAVAVMVGLAYGLGRPWLAWAAFGAFWCCLADPGGRDKTRLLAISGFALAGAVVLPCVSIAGAGGPVFGGLVMLALVFLTNLPRAWGATATVPGILVSVVAVVGVDYPRTPAGALILTGAFLLGCLWALLLCLVLWRIHPHAPVRRAASSIFAREAAMVGEFLALARHGGADVASRQALNAAHRRSVRLAIERGRAAVARLESGHARHELAVDCADRLFAVLIALGHGLVVEEAPRPLPFCLWTLREALLEAERQAATRAFDGTRLAAYAAALAQDAAALPAAQARAMSLSASALAAYAKGPEAQSAHPVADAASPGRISAPILRHAARVTVAVGVAYLLVSWLGLAFSYWATMATVMVMQPLAEATWPRSLERIIGSVGGGVLAALLIALLPAKLLLLAVIFPLAALAIAFKSVNYTVFVLFLTALFVLVIDMLQPGGGIPAARVLNNVIGALVGVAGVLWLWPERRQGGLRALLAAAIRANLGFAAAALAHPAMGQDIAGRERREAGMASAVAETALARMRLEGRGRHGRLDDAAQLLCALRGVAGAAAVRLISGEPGPEDAPRAAQCQALAVALEARMRGDAGAQVPALRAGDDDLAQALAQLRDAASRLRQRA
ncbi:MAG TPA: FUSC family protein [Acidocella sp.]|nr:FUSC family protein [Acidocella sp.]